MKKVLVILVCIIALLFVACDLDELEKTPDAETPSGQSSESGGSGAGQPGDAGGQGGSGSASTNPDDESGSGSGPVVSEYKVGDVGPAGGYIFFDKGSYSDGWRYLEAAPADMKVINGVPTVDATSDAYKNAEIDDQYVLFGYYRKTNDGADLFVNGTDTWQPTNCTQSGIGAGKTNTQLLLDTMGDTAYEHPDYSKENKGSKTAAYAAKLVDLLTYTVGDKTYSDWFIPSIGELNQMYQQLYLKELGGFGAYTYTSSSECDLSNYAYKTDLMKAMSFSTGLFDQVVFRGNGNRIRPVRAF